MVINLATKKELESLNKQWNRSLIATKLTMKEAQLVNQEDAQIVSQIDSIVKTTRDTTFTSFGTIKVKGVIRAPNHYKCINVVTDDLPENQHCKDVAVMQQIQILKPRSNKIPMVLSPKNKKGTKIAHVEASKVVPPLMASQSSENVPKRVVGKPPKSKLLKDLSKEENSRLEKCFESLNLKGIKSWDEQQHQSARDLIMEYQHLFTMNLSELGKTSRFSRI